MWLHDVLLPHKDIIEQVLSKVIREEHVATPHGNWTLPLHAQYPLQIFRHEIHSGENFKPETISSWHLLNPAACLAAVWTNWTICTWNKLHFCKFCANLNINLELDCIFVKPMKRRLQWYLVHTEILSTFHVRVKDISVRKIPHSAHSNQWGTNAENSAKQSLLLEACGPHLVHECLSWSHSPPQTTARLVHAQIRNKGPIGYNGMSQIHSKTAPPFDDHHPHLTPSLDHLQRHPDPFSRFTTADCGQTDAVRQMV